MLMKDPIERCRNKSRDSFSEKNVSKGKIKEYTLSNNVNQICFQKKISKN
ncbi:hypothetical protein LCGC14_1654060 [marine sediment metagenome]|uniref:Uncharacterized protein n=1 Tax=marine sediment metagenome TaxID=412755 RepID=A0A0F9KWA4_9ZZZZ